MAESGCVFWLFVLLQVTPSVFSDVVGQDVNVTAGDDVILPCHLDPPLDVTDQMVKWTLNGVMVHLYRDRADNPDDQDQQFRGRTSLFHSELTRGNISLKLTNVHEEDAGFYTCHVPRLKSRVKTGNVFLTVQFSDVVGHEPVQVEVGGDIILPCHLDPQLDVTDQTVEWTWNNRTVHRYRDRADNSEDQDEQFRGRTSLFHRELVRGNISLKLTNANKEDAGVYFCHVPELQSQIKDGSVSLKVGGDSLGTLAILFFALNALCMVIISARMFEFIRQRIRGEPPDTIVIIRFVLNLLFFITVSALLYLYIRGGVLDPVVIIYSAVITLCIVFTLERVFLVIRKRIRGERLDPVNVIGSVWLVLSMIAASVVLVLSIRRERRDTVVIIISVWFVLSMIAASAVLVLSIRRWRRWRRNQENSRRREQANCEEMNRLGPVPQ